MKFHECDVVVPNKVYRCRACGWTGDLKNAVEHAIKNQIRISNKD